jgi:hypothetical protein
VRIEITSPKKLKLTPEEIKALEIEKAQILASLERPREKQQEPQAEPTQPEKSSNTALPNPLPEPQATVALDVQATADERRRLEAEIERLKTQLVTAKQAERVAQQQAAIAAQQRAQAEGSASLAPWKPKLEKHVAEIARIQRAYGPTLRDFARSMASGYDAQLRQKVQEVYRAAGPLGQKLGDARTTIESALKGLTVAMQSPQAHVHEQARVLAEAALAVNLLELESECASLVQLREELRPGLGISPVTPDHLCLPSTPAPRQDFADFGKEIV